MWLLLLPPLLVFALDQASKWLILWFMDGRMPPIVPVTDFFNLVLVYNPGVSFGLFAQHDPMGAMMMGIFAFVVGLVVIYFAHKADGLERLGYGFIAGGAFGNGLDRFLHGAVVDFLDFHVSAWHFWAFNVADAGITIGVVLLLVAGLRSGSEKVGEDAS